MICNLQDALIVIEEQKQDIETLKKELEVRGELIAESLEVKRCTCGKLCKIGYICTCGKEID